MRKNVVALHLIEEIAANAQSLDPKRDWRESHDSVCAIYRLAHVINVPGCVKNHPSWAEPLARRPEPRRNRKRLYEHKNHFRGRKPV